MHKGDGYARMHHQCCLPPEPVVSAQTSAQIADAGPSQSHSHRDYQLPQQARGKTLSWLFQEVRSGSWADSGIEIVRCFSILSPESRIASRFMENMSFGLTSAWQVLTTRKPDVIYANTWPIFATGILVLSRPVAPYPPDH